MCKQKEREATTFFIPEKRTGGKIVCLHVDFLLHDVDDEYIECTYSPSPAPTPTLLLLMSCGCGLITHCHRQWFSLSLSLPPSLLPVKTGCVGG